MQSIQDMDDNVSRRKSSEVIWNVPNVLTMLRLALIPFFLFFLLSVSYRFTWAPFILFALAGITDHLDGEIARRHGLITDFGKIWDPIADKALTLGAFAALSFLGVLPWWFTVVVAVREFGITYMRKLLLAKDVVVAANFSGKLKTTLQMMLIAFLVVPWGSFIDFSGFPYVLAYWFLLVATLFMTLYSGLGYVLAALKSR